MADRVKLFLLAHDKAIIEIQSMIADCDNQETNGNVWVNVTGVRKDSKLFKALQSKGFKCEHGKDLVLWNPANIFDKSLNDLFRGAVMYANTMRKTLGLKIDVHKEIF